MWETEIAKQGIARNRWISRNLISFPISAIFSPRIEYRYILLNKPVGVTTSALREKITESVPTVYDVLRDAGIDTTELGCVGRLDQDTGGALLFTDDGKLNRRLRGSKSHAEKLYRLVVYSGAVISDEQMASLSSPLDSETLPATIDTTSTWIDVVKGTTSDYTCNFVELNVTLIEGRHRHIRRLCTRAKLRVSSLTRIAFGPIILGDLPTGHARPLTIEEVQSLNSC